MKPESIVLAVAGTFFGLIVGWIIGTQQAGPARPVAPAPQPSLRRRQPPRRRPRCRPRRRRAARRGPGASAAEHRARRTRPTSSRACSSATCTSTPSGIQDAIKWYEAALKLNPKDVERQHRPRRLLLLHEPARPRRSAQFEESLRSRSAARQDAAQPGHREGLRQAGPRRAPPPSWEKRDQDRAEQPGSAGGASARSQDLAGRAPRRTPMPPPGTPAATQTPKPAVRK